MIHNVVVPIGALKSLDSKFVPKLKDVDLVKLLWKSAPDTDKEARLIKWLTLTLGRHSTISDEIKQILWETLADFLSSEKLQAFFDLYGKEIEIKTVFTNRILQELSCPNSSDFCSCMMKVSEALLFNKKLYSEFGFKFQTMTKLSGAWILCLNRYVESKSNIKFLTGAANFLDRLVGKLLQAVEEARIKNAPIFLIKFFMIPALQLCVKIPQHKHCIECFQKVCISIDHVLKNILFSRSSFCSTEYVSQSHSSKEGQSPHENLGSKTALNVTNAFFSKLQESIAENRENRHNLAVAYQIFLGSFSPLETEHNKKIMFFLSSVNVLRAFKEELYLDTYLKLLQSTISDSLHKRTVDDNVKQQMETFYSEFSLLLVDQDFTPIVQECLLLVAKCSHSAVGHRVTLIMESLFRVAHSDVKMDYSWVQMFFNNLFRTFHSIRKPLSMFESVVDSLMEECARNLSSSNHHCIVLCGAVARALSSQSSSSLHPGLAIDLWETLQAKAREILPDMKASKKQVHSQSHVKTGKKRKISDAIISSKKPKLDSSFASIFHCLLILINSILERIEFVEVNTGSLQLRREKINQLLKEILSMMEILRNDLASNEESELMGQYYQLLTTLGHRELLMQKYTVDVTAYTCILNLNNLTKWEVEVGSDCTARYRWKQWQCFRIQLAATKVFDSPQKQKEENSELHEAICNLLSTPSDSTSGNAEWDGLPETINSEEILVVGTLSLVESFLPAVLYLSSDENLSDLARLLHRNFNSSQKLTPGHVSASSIARDLFGNSTLLESRRFHNVFVKTQLKTLQSRMKGKKNKAFASLLKYARSICSSRDVIDDVELSRTIVKLFGRPHVDEVVRSALTNTLTAFLLLPYHSFPPNQASAMLTLLICYLSYQDEDDCLQHQCLAAIEKIMNASNSLNFNKFFPQSVFLPYFTSRSRSYKQNAQSSIQRLLLTQNNLDFQAPVGDLMPAELSIEDDSITTALWILRLGTETMREILAPPSSTSAGRELPALWLPDDVTSLEGRDLPDDKLLILSHWVEALRSLIKDCMICDQTQMILRGCDFCGLQFNCMPNYNCLVPSRVMDNLNPEASIYFLKHVQLSSVTSQVLSLFEHVIIASFYVDCCPGQHKSCQAKLLKKRHNFINWFSDVIKDMKNNSAIDILRSKMKLLLAVIKLIRLSRHNKSRLSRLSAYITSSQVAFDVIGAYRSSMTQQSNSDRALLDRVLVELHLLLSPQECEDRFSLCRENLIFSDDNETLCASVLYCRVIFVNYNELVKPVLLSAAKDQPELLHQLHVRFFNGIYFDLTRLVNRLTSADQSYLTTLREAFHAINDMLLIKIIPGRLAILAVPSILRIELASLLLNNRSNDDFLSFFALHCNFASLILFHSSSLLRNIAALVLSICRKLLRVCICAARKTPDSTTPEAAKQCAFLIEKFFHSLATHHKSAFRKFAPFLVADYLDLVTTSDLYPSIVNKLDTAVFHIFSICSEPDYRFINGNLSETLRPRFHNFLQTYNSKFKYTGWV